MAKIQEEIYMVKLSRLVKDEVESPEDIGDERLVTNVEGLVQQMINNVAVVVEVEKVS